MHYFTSVQSVEDWIFGLRYTSAKDGLNNMLALCQALGDPQRDLRFVHVAGTDGKGSVCAMLDRMLRACGYRVGLYTSPHLMRFSERMRVNGAPVADDLLIRVCSQVREATESLLARDIRPNFFELCTAAAFLAFREVKADIVVLETGMGGRMDATNVVTPEVCLITSIGLDHTRQLGNTLSAIAGEKAGILKSGVPFALAPQSDESVLDVFARAAHEKNASETYLGDLPFRVLREDRFGSDINFWGLSAQVRLPGWHQAQNACLAISGLRLLARRGWTIDEAAALAALPKTKWPARLEWLDEHTLLDGAHNPHGGAALRDYVKAHLAGERVVALIGMMKDKAVSDCAPIYAQAFSRAVATQISYPRAMDASALADALRQGGLAADAEPDMRKALARARTLAGDGIVLICGSLYLAGDMRLFLKDDGGIL